MAFVVTAVATAIEVGTVAAIATAVSEVGIAMTVVGAVTGSKDLMKIGSVLGIAGGVGSLAASFAGSAGAAVSAGTDLATEGAATTLSDAATNTALDEASKTAMDSFGGEAGEQAAQQAGIDSMQGAAPNGIVNGEAGLAPATAASMAPTTSTSLTPTMDTPSTSLPGPADVQTPAGGTTGVSTPVDTSPASSGSVPGGDTLSRRLGLDATTANGPTSGMFDQFTSWVKANPKLAELGLQVVGGAMKGAADMSVMNRRLDQQQQLINMQSYGNQVGTYAPKVNATPGIVNSART
jgi:hypothetical protein